MSLTGGYAVQALWEGKRLDGRGLMDSRDIDITFGLDWGSCQVTLGRSRVLAQVSLPSKHIFILASFVQERREVFY
jgi:exosome complex RNA-binding protein Rrp42 (RNase PH superfamily)